LQLAGHNHGDEAIIAGEFEYPQPVPGQEDVMFGAELVGRAAGACYKEEVAGGKLLKRNFFASSKTLRCCRDRCRPWAKNSVNSKGPWRSTIRRVLRAT
jgi:hypothetical protein